MFSGQGYIYDGSVKDLNPGMYFCTGSVTDLPDPNFYFVNITSLTPGNEDRIIKAYDPSIGRQYALCRINGVWATSWSTEVLTSDLDIISVSQDITSNVATKINGCSSKNYIPYIVGAATNPSFKYNFIWIQGELAWYLTTDVSQKYHINFYKYPA